MLVEAPVDTKYARREPKLYGDLPEPLGMFMRLAEPDLSITHPLHPFASSLKRYNWSAPIDQIAQDLEQEPTKVSKLAELYQGVLKTAEGIISLKSCLNLIFL